MAANSLRATHRRLATLEGLAAERPDKYAAYLAGLSDEEFRQEVARRRDEFVADGYLAPTEAGYRVADSVIDPEDRDFFERFVKLQKGALCRPDAA